MKTCGDVKIIAPRIPNLGNRHKLSDLRQSLLDSLRKNTGTRRSID